MASILVLHDDASVRERLSKILKPIGFRVVTCASTEEASKHDARTFDLYLCGQMGKYSDGLIYALDAKDKGAKVVIISERKKFHQFPLLHIGAISDQRVVEEVEKQLAGD